MTFYVIDQNGSVISAFSEQPQSLPASHLVIDSDVSGAPDSGKYQRWGGASWENIANRSDIESNDRALRELNEMQALKAIILWVAQKHGLTPTQARSEVTAIYKTL